MNPVAVRRERARIRKAVRELRGKWLVRLALRSGFEGAARAVQALDEALAAIKPPRKR